MKLPQKIYLLCILSQLFLSLWIVPGLSQEEKKELMKEKRPKVIEALREREKECQKAIKEMTEYLANNYKDSQRNIANLLLIAEWFEKDWVNLEEEVHCEGIKSRKDCVDCLLLALSKYSYEYQRRHWPTGKEEIIQLLDKIIEHPNFSEMKPYAMILKIHAYAVVSGGLLKEDTKKEIEICNLLIKTYPKTLFAAFAQMAKGLAYSNIGEYDRAIMELRKLKDYDKSYVFFGKSIHSLSDELIKETLEYKNCVKRVLNKQEQEEIEDIE
jgi:tetratricopeptide (TPR) repeat protein